MKYKLSIASISLLYTIDFLDTLFVHTYLSHACAPALLLRGKSTLDQGTFHIHVHMHVHTMCIPCAYHLCNYKCNYKKD